MSAGQPHHVLRQLRSAALLQDGGGMTDGQLLELFLTERDDAAFEALVRRHGPMVLGVCRRLLRNPEDAEDAFQATFLVLARKAASIGRRELLGNWLYGVAHRTSLRARSAAARRRAREKQVSAIPEPEAKDGADAWRDLRPVLDQELSRLPDKYRVPVVLCDLEGRTLRGVAQQLGVPAGTLSGRLTAARGLLAKRLARHGLALSGGALTAALSEGAAACVPPPLVALTVEGAAAVAAGKVAAGVVSARAAALTEGVVRAMFVKKLKIATAVVLLAGTAIGATLLGHRPTAAQPPAGPARTRAVAPQADGPGIKALLKERQEVLKKEVLARTQEYEAGRGYLASLLAASRELLKAELELATNREERVAAYERHFDAMRKFDQMVKEGYEAGRIKAADHYEMRSARLEAEIGLLRAGGKPPKEKAEGK
jgi:RNA polymerase sigma-70 factor (ECF subfamily)